MKLYLVQHGEAKPKEQDPERPLTPRGAETVRRVVSLVAGAKISAGEILHSGKRRAEQTAEILAEQLRPRSGLRAVAGLDPNDDPKPLARKLDREDADLMIVGHLPFLARLAALLVVGDDAREVVRFQMGGIVCLERNEEGRWAVAWAVTSDLV